MIIKNENIVERKIHDTYFLIDITQNYLDDKCRLYEINEIGDYIWQQLDRFDNVADITNALVDCVVDEVEYSEIYNDVEEFIQVLVEEKFLEVSNGRD